MKELIVRGHLVLVSDEDYDLVIKYRWCIQRGGKNLYAVATITGKAVYLHRLIMDAPVGSVVDHINGNGLDNRRENLRFCTKAQNFQNGSWRPTPRRTSKYKGVWFIKRSCRRCWRCAITANMVRRNIGTFLTEQEAARAYDAAARVLHGAFARLNFPDPRGEAA